MSALIVAATTCFAVWTLPGLYLCRLAWLDAQDQWAARAAEQAARRYVAVEPDAVDVEAAV